jgi:chlorite dismutase
LVTGTTAVAGEPLAPVARIDVVHGNASAEAAAWVLRGVTSNERYIVREEREQLATASPPLGRSHATLAALIPIRKSSSWWELAQNERRAILAEDSHHIAIGQQYLPAIARRLHHSRDLGEPFDFLTWFEYAPGDAGAFDELVARLRQTEEWKYVEREVDIRLEKAG